jgi:hypothetical protein
MSLLRRVKHRLLCLTSGAGDSDGAHFYSQTGEDRFRPHFVAVEWLEFPSVKQAILSGVHCFLEQQKYELMCKTAATPIFCESETVDSGRCG